MALGPGGISSLFPVNFGYLQNGQYYVNNQCLMHLQELSEHLVKEDPNVRPLRRALGFHNIIKEDLILIILNCNKRSDIHRANIKLLFLLTLPIEYLVNLDDLDSSAQAINELTQSLYEAKKSFSESETIKAILNPINLLFKKGKLISNEDKELINYSILLIKNILHPVPIRLQSDTDLFPHKKFSQSILSNLFTHGLDRLIIRILAASQHHDEIVVAVCQLLPELYQNQSSDEILLTIMNQRKIGSCPIDSSSTSDSDESNTSNQSAEENFSQGKEVSDSKNQGIGKRCKLKSRRVRSQLAKRCQSILNSKISLENQVEEVENKSTVVSVEEMRFQDLTISFLSKDFNPMVGRLLDVIIKDDTTLQFDKSNFLWLVTYFLPLASKLEMSVCQVQDILTSDLLGYLIWVAFNEAEEIELKYRLHSTDYEPSFRRLHLSVLALKEYLIALNFYSSHQASEASDNSKKYQSSVMQLRNSLHKMSELRKLFLFLFRVPNPPGSSPPPPHDPSPDKSQRIDKGYQDFLREVIQGNHELLSTLQVIINPKSGDLYHYLEEFFSQSILSRYGMVLRSFEENGDFLNDCILTILHHVCFDFGRVDLLFDPSILNSLDKIFKMKYEVFDGWNDLITHVWNKLRIHSSNQEQSSPIDTQVPLNISSDPDIDDLSSLSDEELKLHLLNSGFKRQLDWVQSALLSACTCRLATDKDNQFLDPIANFSRKLNLGCPLVPWTEMEASGLRSKDFLFLLSRLNLLSPDLLYPRIPNHWSADMLYSLALFFGPVEPNQVSFDLNLVSQIELSNSF